MGPVQLSCEGVRACDRECVLCEGVRACDHECVLCEGVRATRTASGVLRILMESLECTIGSISRRVRDLQRQ